MYTNIKGSFYFIFFKKLENVETLKYYVMVCRRFVLFMYVKWKTSFREFIREESFLLFYTRSRYIGQV